VFVDGDLPRYSLSLLSVALEPLHYISHRNSCFFSQRFDVLARLLAQKPPQEVQRFDLLVMKHVPNDFRSIESMLRSGDNGTLPYEYKVLMEQELSLLVSMSLAVAGGKNGLWDGECNTCTESLCPVHVREQISINAWSSRTIPKSKSPTSISHLRHAVLLKACCE